jgi:AT-rich interactive domain-containing protein 4A
MVYSWRGLTVTGQSSDSEDLPAMDSSSNCTPVKRLTLPKSQKLPRSPARTSPHIKDAEKEKHREKHPNSSPRTYKWSFQLSKGLPDSLSISWEV